MSMIIDTPNGRLRKNDIQKGQTGSGVGVRKFYVARHMKFLLWPPTLWGAGDEVSQQMHASASPTPHNFHQRLRRNCISLTSSFQRFRGTAPRISQVARRTVAGLLSKQPSA